MPSPCGLATHCHHTECPALVTNTHTHIRTKHNITHPSHNLQMKTHKMQLATLVILQHLLSSFKLSRAVLILYSAAHTSVLSITWAAWASCP